MGRCAHGILGFAQSFDSFTRDGAFVYHRFHGIHALGRPAR